jgi:hypothetical protein
VRPRVRRRGIDRDGQVDRGSCGRRSNSDGDFGWLGDFAAAVAAPGGGVRGAAGEEIGVDDVGETEHEHEPRLRIVRLSFALVGQQRPSRCSWWPEHLSGLSSEATGWQGEQVAHARASIDVLADWMPMADNEGGGRLIGNQGSTPNRAVGCGAGARAPGQVQGTGAWGGDGQRTFQ